MPRSRCVAVLVFTLLLAGEAAAQSGDASGEKAVTTPEAVGGVVLGDPQWRRSHFSAKGQGYYYPSYLAPCSWAGGGGCAAPRPRRSSADANPGYRGKRYYDALAYRSKRHYARERYYNNRSYSRERYDNDRHYARERYYNNRRYARERY